MSGYNEHPGGTKVDLGEDAPVTREGAGTVPANSLAAESYNKGGEFADNAGAKPDKDTTTAGKVYGETGRPHNPQGEAVPNYVGNQFSQGSKPHGRNITEDPNLADIDAKDGLKKALASEPGSRDDPSRLAEHQMGLTESSVPGGGPRENNLDRENPYDTLNRKAST